MAKILHVIAGLENGGAESVLSRLVVGDRRNLHEVISMTDSGVFGGLLTEAGVPVRTLGMSRGRLSLAGVRRLHTYLRVADPDLVQTWMYHADLVGGLAAKLMGHRAVCWGVRNGYPASKSASIGTRLVARLCAAVSRVVPARIISCSYAGAREHAAIGYSRARIVVIPNGCDVNAFRPDPGARQRLRADWALSADTFVLGMVARWDLHKDHASLVRALGGLQLSIPTPWTCCFIGPGMTDGNHQLVQLLRQGGVRERVRLVGPRSDIGAVMNAIDVHVLSSAGEAFPNVVAEAMACGTPCVVTDVGDAAMIVGDTGWVLPAADHIRLAEAIGGARLELGKASAWAARQNAARRRIVEHFSLSKMVLAYQGVWAECLADDRKRPAANG